MSNTGHQSWSGTWVYDRCKILFEYYSKYSKYQMMQLSFEYLVNTIQTSEVGHYGSNSWILRTEFNFTHTTSTECSPLGLVTFSSREHWRLHCGTTGQKSRARGDLDDWTWWWNCYSRCASSTTLVLALSHSNYQDILFTASTRDTLDSRGVYLNMLSEYLNLMWISKYLNLNMLSEYLNMPSTPNRCEYLNPTKLNIQWSWIS